MYRNIYLNQINSLKESGYIRDINASFANIYTKIYQCQLAVDIYNGIPSLIHY